MSLQLSGATARCNSSRCCCLAPTRCPSASARRRSRATPVSRWRMESRERPDGVVVVNDIQRQPRLDARGARRARGHRDAGSAVGRPRQDARARADSDREHAAIGSYAAGLGVDHVVAVGDGARSTAPSSGFRTSTLPTGSSRHACSRATSCCSKSSRDSGLRWLGDRLAGTGEWAEGRRGHGRGTLWTTGLTSETRGRWPVKGVLAAAAFSLLFSLLGTPTVHQVPRASRLRPVRPRRRADHDHTKRGTPTMGGAVILATLGAYAAAHLVTLTPLTASGCSCCSS